MKDIRGKNAVITGASKGLGVYIAKAIAGRGANVALAARSADALEDVRAACAAMGVRAVAIPCDVGSDDDMRRLIATAERELGSIDILVNNAGIEFTEAHHLLSLEQIEELTRVNLYSPMALSRLVLPEMIRRGSGAIVNVASLAGKGPSPYNSIYAASKAGLIGFSESLGVEVDGTGVTVGVVCPSFVSEAGMWARTSAESGAKTPRMAQPTTPAKVAAAVLKVIGGAEEVIVAPGPMRPLLAFGQLAPGMKRGIIRRMGVLKTFKEAAEYRRLGADRPEAAQEEAEPAAPAAPGAAPGA